MKEEFVILIQENEGIIFKVCRMYCQNREDSEDLYQDIVLQLWRSFPSYKGDAKISTWMYRIGINTAVTRIRRETKREKYGELNSEALQIPSNVNSEPNDMSEQMNYAIQQLSEVERAITMLYLEDYCYKDIAEIIGISESNIGFKLNQIKKKLKVIINSESHGIK